MYTLKFLRLIVVQYGIVTLGGLSQRFLNVEFVRPVRAYQCNSRRAVQRKARCTQPNPSKVTEIRSVFGFYDGLTGRTTHCKVIVKDTPGVASKVQFCEIMQGNYTGNRKC